MLWATIKLKFRAWHRLSWRCWSLDGSQDLRMTPSGATDILVPGMSCSTLAQIHAIAWHWLVKLRTSLYLAIYLRQKTNHELHGSCTRSISAPSILRTAAFLPTGGRVPHYCLSAQCFPWLREQENWQASASHWTCEAYVWMLQIMLCCHIGP